jgi:hypothetical protein
MSESKSNRASGREFELWVRDWFQERGYVVHVCGRKAVMIGPGKLITKGDDIFGCDCICLKADEKPLFIQATLDSGVQKRLDELKKYPWNLNFVQVQLWQKTKTGDINVKLFTGEAFKDIGKVIRKKFYERRQT